jgi:hypothetical protein
MRKPGFNFTEKFATIVPEETSHRPVESKEKLNQDKPNGRHPGTRAIEISSRLSPLQCEL